MSEATGGEKKNPMGFFSHRNDVFMVAKLHASKKLNPQKSTCSSKDQKVEVVFVSEGKVFLLILVWIFVGPKLI